MDIERWPATPRWLTRDHFRTGPYCASIPREDAECPPLPLTVPQPSKKPSNQRHRQRHHYVALRVRCTH